MSESTEANKYPRRGELIDEKYRVERMLGAGGMGAVLEATHLLRRAPVALKFMSPRLIDDPGIVERFLNEGVAASRISNEHVVTVLDVSKLANGQPYLVMEYLEGRDLAKLLASEGEPGLADISRCVHFVLQILRGLQVAHIAGIVHRDLKPANCLVVERDDEPDFLKIVDFGISKVNAEPLHLTQVGSALGTPLYVSPEQARDAASVDARSDLYSVSVILYQLLCGRTPFQPASGQLSEVFMLLATSTPPSLDEARADLPTGLDAAVQRGLAKSPSDRYRSAADMATALAPFSDARSERVLRQLLQRPTSSPRGLRVAAEMAAPGRHPPQPGAQWSSETVLEVGQTPAPAGFRTVTPPTETAAATTGPAFLQRRQTELLVGVPLLIIIAVAALVLRRGGGDARPASEGRPVQVQRIDLVPAGPLSARVRANAPGTRPLAEAGPTNPRQEGALGKSTGVAHGPTPLPSTGEAAETATPILPSRAASTRADRTRAGSPTKPAPLRRDAPSEKRRPSLKQIGIEE